MWGRARWNFYSARALPNLSVCTAHSSILSPELLVTIATHWLTVSITASEVVPIFIRRPFMLSDYWRTAALTVSLTYHQSIVLASSRKNTFSLPAASCCQTFPLLTQSKLVLPLHCVSWPITSVRMPCRRHSSKDMKTHDIHFTRWSKFGSIPRKGLWNTTVLKHRLRTNSPTTPS